MNGTLPASCSCIFGQDGMAMSGMHAMIDLLPCAAVHVVYSSGTAPAPPGAGLAAAAAGAVVMCNRRMQELAREQLSGGAEQAQQMSQKQPLESFLQRAFGAVGAEQIQQAYVDASGGNRVERRRVVLEYSTDLSSRTTDAGEQLQQKQRRQKQRWLELSIEAHSGGQLWLLWDVTAAVACEQRLTLIDTCSPTAFLMCEGSAQEPPEGDGAADADGGVCSSTSTVRECNDAALTLLGASTPEEVVGRPLASFAPRLQPDGVPSADAWAEVVREATQAASISGDGASVTCCKWTTREASSDAQRHMDMWVAPSHVLGEPVTAVFWQDSTLYVKREEQLEEARARADKVSQNKSLFLANMSHEIRTPMNGVIGVAELLLNTELTAEQRSYLEIIQSSGDNLLRIISDVLDLSKIESQSLELEAVEFNIHKQVSDAHALLTVVAEERGLELHMNVAEDVPVMVVGDPVRIRQVLLNLMSNAVKFTRSGGSVWVSLRCASEDEAAEVARQREATAKPPSEKRHVLSRIASYTAASMRAGSIGSSTDSTRAEEEGNAGPREPEKRALLRFEVKDNGVGIDEAAQSKLFQPFTQADSATTRKFGGTGLGLAICRLLVQLMGGTIGLTSKPGQGSTFFFYANVGVAEWRPTAGGLSGGKLLLRTRSEDLQAALKGIHVLVAEDNKVNQLVAMRMLKNFGIQCDLVDNGEQAVRSVAAKHYDLVLMDCHMPIMDGFEATRIIRQAEAKCAASGGSSTSSSCGQGSSVPMPMAVSASSPAASGSAGVAAAAAAGGGCGGGSSLSSIPSGPGFATRTLIVALTASALSNDKEKCLAAGMDSFLSKPIRPADLQQVINTHLSHLAQPGSSVCQQRPQQQQQAGQQGPAATSSRAVAKTTSQPHMVRASSFVTHRDSSPLSRGSSAAVATAPHAMPPPRHHSRAAEHDSSMDVMTEGDEPDVDMERGGEIGEAGGTRPCRVERTGSGRQRPPAAPATAGAVAAAVALASVHKSTSDKSMSTSPDCIMEHNGRADDDEELTRRTAELAAAASEVEVAWGTANRPPRRRSRRSGACASMEHIPFVPSSDDLSGQQ